MSHIESIISQFNTLDPSAPQRDFLKKEIFTLLKEKYHTGTEKTFHHHYLIHTFQTFAGIIKGQLTKEGILQPLKTLRDDKRKEEITDTSLVSYLELLFGNDTLEYMSRKRDNETISSTSDYLQQQSLIIQSLDFNLGYLTDREVKLLFSTCTDHKRHDKDVNGFSSNIIHYRHQAIAFIPKLKEVFATAIPYKLNANELSYKVITLTQGPGTGKLIEFRFRSPLDEHRHENRLVLVSVHDSLSQYHEKLNQSLDTIRQKILHFEQIKIEFKQRYNENIHITDKNIWYDKTEELLVIFDQYHNLYIDRISARLHKTQEHKKYMHAPQYAMTMAAMLRDLDLAIQDQTAKFHRLQQYAKDKL